MTILLVQVTPNDLELEAMFDLDELKKTRYQDVAQAWLL